MLLADTSLRSSSLDPRSPVNGRISLKNPFLNDFSTLADSHSTALSTFLADWSCEKVFPSKDHFSRPTLLLLFTALLSLWPVLILLIVEQTGSRAPRRDDVSAALSAKREGKS